MSSLSLFRCIEDDRLDAHFDWVLALLRAQPSNESSDETRSARERSLSLLENYARRRRFPRSSAIADRLTPVFVDEAGTTCAVAQLLVDTGEHTLVDTIQRTMNRAYIEEMESADLVAWCVAAGLTLDEIALIQPAYCGEGKSPTTCTYKSNPCGPLFNDAGCECVTQTLPDGYECDLSPPSVCKGGLCRAGACTDPVQTCPKPANSDLAQACKAYTTCVAEAESNQAPTSPDCTCTTVANPSSAGAPAALLAALFLAALARRRYRA